MATMGELYRQGPPPPDADKVVFLVDIQVIDYEKDKFVTVASNIELRWPVWYDYEVVAREILLQHPEIQEKHKSRTLYHTITYWCPLTALEDYKQKGG